jgi:hypothetical protein
MRQHIDAAKQDLSSAQLKTTIADARDAADSLGRNLRSAADAVAPASVETNFSVLKAFAVALTELTMKVDDCTRKLAGLAEQPDQGRQPQRPFAPASNDGLAAHDPGGPASSDSRGPRTIDHPLYVMQEDAALGGSSTSDAVEANAYSSSQDKNGAENRDSPAEARNRAWWPWRRE